MRLLLSEKYPKCAGICNISVVVITMNTLSKHTDLMVIFSLMGISRIIKCCHCAIFCQCRWYTLADIEASRTVPNIWHLHTGTAQSAHITEWKLA